MTTPATIVPLFLDHPVVRAKSALYNANPNLLLTGLYFPVDDTIVIDGNVAYVVENANTTTLTFDLVPMAMSDDTDGFGLTSVVSYGNDAFRALYDTRTQPYTLNPDAMLKFYGGSPSRYQIVRYPDTDQAVVISQSFDSTGQFISNTGAVQAVADNSMIFVPVACTISQVPADDERLKMVIFNESGSEVGTVYMLAKEGQIINDLSIYQPKIISLSVKTNQTLTNGDSYLFQQQSVDSLGIQAILSYQDGTTRTVPIDGRQCKIFGTEDLVASYPGMQQTVLLVYYLSLDEVSAATLTQGNGSISTTFNVVVVPNQLAAPIKISVIPTWNAGTNAYTLRYLYYTTTGKIMKDITNQVTITQGQFQGANYLDEQVFNISVDLSTVDNTTYQTTTNYTQSVAIRLRPSVALVRWTLRDSTSSPYIYGADSSSDRRPLLFFDTSRSQHFISSSLFPAQQNFLQSYFYDANPPYDPTVNTQAVTPTHFNIRDPYRGVLLTPDAIPVANYNQAMSLIISNDPSGFVGNTLVVEFISRTSGTGSDDVIIYGTPVDVYAGTYA